MRFVMKVIPEPGPGEGGLVAGRIEGPPNGELDMICGNVACGQIVAHHVEVGSFTGKPLMCPHCGAWNRSDLV